MCLECTSASDSKDSYSIVLSSRSLKRLSNYPESPFLLLQRGKGYGQGKHFQYSGGGSHFMPVI